MPKPTEDQTGTEGPDPAAEAMVTPAEAAEPAEPARDDPDGVAPESPSDPAPDGVDRPEPAAPMDPARAEPAKGGGVVLPVLLGAALGAGVSLFALAAGLVPLPADPAVAALRAQVAEAGEEARRAAATTEDLRATLAPLAADLAALRGAEAPAPVDLAPLADRVAALETGLAALGARLSDAEAAPAGAGAAPAAALDALGRELEALRADVAAARQAGTSAEDRLAAIVAEAESRLAAREAEVADRAAADAAEAAARRADTALSSLRAALDGDRPIAPALAEVRAAGVDLPPDLAGAPEPPTLAELRAEYPLAARRALSAALKAGAEGGFADRALAFLRAQTGARSLTPRDGADPDAVLSRAEAALAGGDIAAALAELDALPPEARAEMADWTERAEARRAVADAIAALAARQG